MRINKAQTTFEAQGLNLAVFIARHFNALKHSQVEVKPKKQVSKNIQEYLNNNIHRIHENHLLGIVAVKDVWKNSTGGRVHLFAGLKGPLGESLEDEVIQTPIDYELKNRVLLNAVKDASGESIPNGGKIHFHPRLCKGEKFTVATLFEFIRKEHGWQNDLQQIADSRIFLLMYTVGLPYWRPINQEILIKLFSAK